MSKQDIVKKLEELETLTKGMDVPDFKRRNVYWLRKNLADRNAKHKNYEKVINLVHELANQGVSGA